MRTCQYYGSHLQSCSTCSNNFRLISTGERQEGPCPKNKNCKRDPCHSCRYKMCLKAGMQTARIKKFEERRAGAELLKNNQNTDKSHQDSSSHNVDSTTSVLLDKNSDNGIISISSKNVCAQEVENAADADISLPMSCENTAGQDLSLEINARNPRLSIISCYALSPSQWFDDPHQEVNIPKLEAYKQEIEGSAISSCDILIKKVKQQRDVFSKFMDLLQGFKKKFAKLEQELKIGKTDRVNLNVIVCKEMELKTSKSLSRLNKLVKKINDLSNNDQVGLCDDGRVLIEKLSLELLELEQKAQSRIKDLTAILDRLRRFAEQCDKTMQTIIDVENQLLKFKPVDWNVEPLQKLQMDLEAFNSAIIKPLGVTIEWLEKRLLYYRKYPPNSLFPTLPTAQLDLDMGTINNLKQRFQKLNAAAESRVQIIKKAAENLLQSSLLLRELDSGQSTDQTL